ncbi:anti-sigma factor [Pseudalkalibacillus decolorationis]|uniref:anti-sigma factor n=1 Tax=Pseudalkalibacillus decolorationis TaxID=163879 RepID=UPI0021483BA0|nr:anti-sigma factor [Pseudalkalibacillus decolorationis]
MNKECEHLAAYVAFELSQEEYNRFEHHLSQCKACSSELKELQDAWFALPYDAEEADVPPDLKSEVMNYVFTEKSTEVSAERGFITTLLKWKCAIKPHFTPLASTIVVLLFITVAGLIYQNLQLNQVLSDIEESASSPVKITRTLALQSATPSSNAQGYAAVIETEYGRELIVHLNQLPKIQGEQAYQVWLLNDGKRKNAGTFRPAPNGKGVITYRLPDTDFSFENIGITLEPDDRGTKPRGKKVVGTS